MILRKIINDTKKNLQPMEDGTGTGIHTSKNKRSKGEVDQSWRLDAEVCEF